MFLCVVIGLLGDYLLVEILKETQIVRIKRMTQIGRSVLSVASA